MISRRDRRAAAYALAIAIGLTLAGGARGQDQPAAASADASPVTLGAALTQALRPGNLTVGQQDANVEGAAGKLQEAKGEFDWNTHVEGGWQQLYIPRAVNGFLTDTTSTISSYYYHANIGRKFRNGIEIAPGVTAYPGAGATPAQTAGLTQIRPALGLKVPLLKGLGTESADAEERAAQDSLQGARRTRGFAMQQYALSVATTFWRCIADDRAMEIAYEANLHSELYGDTMTKMVKQGLVEATIQQQWAANNVAQQLNLGRAQDESQKCRRDLAYAMTGGTAEPWPAATGELPIVADLAPVVGQIREGAMDDLAIARRQDLKAAADNLMAAREALHSSDNDTRPELDLNLDPDKAIISFTKAFGSNAAKGHRAQASAEESKADLALRQLQDQVHMQVSDALVSLRRSASDWRALDDAERQMETVVIDAEKRAKFGSITWANLLDTQNQLTQLRQQVINARLQFAIALGNLRLATGTIDADQPSILASDITRPPTP